MDPNQVAAEQQRQVIVAQQKAALQADLINHAHISAMAATFSVLLDKWLSRHQRITGEYPMPTPNDLRWLSKMAFYFAAYVPEAAKLCRVDDSKLDALAGIDKGDALSFENLFSVGDPK